MEAACKPQSERGSAAVQAEMLCPLHPFTWVWLGRASLWQCTGRDPCLAPRLPSGSLQPGRACLESTEEIGAEGMGFLQMNGGDSRPQTAQACLSIPHQNHRGSPSVSCVHHSV